MAEKPTNGGGPAAADASAAMEVEDDATVTAAPSAATAVVQPDMVVVHPLVLLSVVDHYNREAKVGDGPAAMNVARRSTHAAGGERPGTLGACGRIPTGAWSASCLASGSARTWTLRTATQVRATPRRAAGRGSRLTSMSAGFGGDLRRRSAVRGGRERPVHLVL